MAICWTPSTLKVVLPEVSDPKFLKYGKTARLCKLDLINIRENISL
eukprot:CAMPEP_0175029346 /NCGR_PEP_ID=MMETSP0005-20121125/19555_1 /TAXON_ID=420556 /ORGANISM="Ochromonas sp., Strain CCMP1393" /LENGTH=45 /DNA_ID= /DNA_START= /DNA_END= /DNA_ORIENTATION=